MIIRELTMNGRDISDLVHRILQGEAPTDMVLEGEPILVVMARHNQMEACLHLIAGGVNIDTISKVSNGNTALIEACARGHIDLVKAIVACGANLEQKNTMGHTALMAAVMYKQQEIVECLLLNGAVVNTSDHHHMTPLMMAAAKGYCHLVKTLLEAGANKDHRDLDGDHALTLAYTAGNLELVQLLRGS